MSSSLLRSSARPSPYVCAQCTFQSPTVVNKVSRRWIGLKYLAKVAKAEMEWQEKAVEIKKKDRPSMLSILEERGYVQTIAGDRSEFDNLLTDKRVGAYVGIDPTASSMHVGHMLPLMSLFWMYMHGYHTVTLLGGATAKIGDPTGRTSSRPKTAAAIRTANMVAMHYQLKKIWLNVEAYGRKYGYIWEWAWHRELVNNNAWMNKLSLMEVLQVLGPGMRIGTMLSRDTVKNKMENGDGMSFSEFSYPLLQGWDWWHMYNTKGIQVQIGGSDQFGNIVAGIDAVKYICANHPDPDVRKGKEATNHLMKPMGFTVPLLTAPSGEKFGKSAGNAIWLDKEQTSPFDLYQFFLRQSDDNVSRYLKLFTFMPIDQIDTVVAEHMKDPKQRKAQHLLAREFVELIHGPEEAQAAESQHRLIFSNNSGATVGASSAEQSAESADPTQKIPTTLNNAPGMRTILPASLVLTKSIGRILFGAGLASSASEGHRLASSQSVYIGGAPGNQGLPMSTAAVAFTPIKVWKVEDTQKYLIGGEGENKLLVLRKGKHHVRIIEIVSDSVWNKKKASGEVNPYPGEQEAVKLTSEESEAEKIANRKKPKKIGKMPEKSPEVISKSRYL